jgi:hypothetical protein
MILSLVSSAMSRIEITENQPRDPRGNQAVIGAWVPLSGLVESADRPMLRPILKLNPQWSPTSHPLGS